MFKNVFYLAFLTFWPAALVYFGLFKRRNWNKFFFVCWGIIFAFSGWALHARAPTPADDDISLSRMAITNGVGAVANKEDPLYGIGIHVRPVTNGVWAVAKGEEFLLFLRVAEKHGWKYMWVRKWQTAEGETHEFCGLERDKATGKEFGAFLQMEANKGSFPREMSCYRFGVNDARWLSFEEEQTMLHVLYEKFYPPAKRKFDEAPQHLSYLVVSERGELYYRGLGGHRPGYLPDWFPVPVWVYKKE